MIIIKKNRKKEIIITIKFKKEENKKPLELRKRARDPIQDTTPSILST